MGKRELETCGRHWLVATARLVTVPHVDFGPPSQFLPPPPRPKPTKMGALEFLCDIRFHRSFVFSPAKTGKPYRLSYADFGDPSSDAVVLFCGALMGARFCYSPLDQLAKAYNVRIIHPDRPGIGGSDAVELQERIPVWLGQ